MPTDPRAFHEEIFVMDGLSPSGLTKEYVTETLPGAGIDAKHETVASPGDSFREAIEKILAYQNRIAEWPGVIQARSVTDLQADGLSVVFGFQDTTPIEDTPALVGVFDQLGIRIIQLTYNSRNLAGNGCTERVDGGLSKYGLEVIDAIETHDLLLDLSHVGPQSAADALGVASQPAVFSHSNPNAVYDHPRNISDDLIQAAVDTGGTIGVNAFPDVVAADPTLDDLIDHIDYLCGLAGHDHVTLGLDFIDNRDYADLTFPDDPHYTDPPYTYPTGIESAADIPNITAKLTERDYSDEAIRAVMGENLLRVYGQVWTD